MKSIIAPLVAVLIVAAGCSSGTDAEEDATNADGRGLLAQAEDLQGQLNPFFEGCEWEVTVDDGNQAQTSCSEHEIGVIVGLRDQTTTRALETVSENVPVGGYVREGNWAVWSTDESNVNMAWDVLGASGERVWF